MQYRIVSALYHKKDLCKQIRKKLMFKFKAVGRYYKNRLSLV